MKNEKPLITYHLNTFNPTPKEFYNLLKKYFPNFKINYIINHKRQQMVNSWPMDTDDSAAKKEWNWQPVHNLDNGLSEYLIPDLKEMYK